MHSVAFGAFVNPQAVRNPHGFRRGGLDASARILFSLVLAGMIAVASPITEPAFAQSLRTRATETSGGGSSALNPYPSEEGSSSREARSIAIQGLPFSQLTPEANQRIRAVVDDASYFRRMPTQTVECDAAMYQFLVRHPEVVVNIWDLMGITKVTLSRIGEYQLTGSDGAGTTCKMDLVYGSDTLHIYQSQGNYEGNLWPRELRGHCVVALHNRAVKLPDGRPGMVAWMDAFMRLENAGADLVVKALGPLVGKTADQNFVECAGFFSQISQTARANPVGLQQVASRLNKVSPEVRKDFMRLCATSSMKPGQAIPAQQAITQGIATSTRRVVQKRPNTETPEDPEGTLNSLNNTDSPTLRLLTNEGAFDPR